MFLSLEPFEPSIEVVKLKVVYESGPKAILKAFYRIYFSRFKIYL